MKTWTITFIGGNRVHTADRLAVVAIVDEMVDMIESISTHSVAGD